MTIEIRRRPWTDRSGRFSPPRAIAFAVALVPAVILALRWGLEDLGPRPLAEAIHVSGDWAIRFVLAAIAVTPLARLSGTARLVAARRTIGLAGLFWATVHVGLWAADLGFAPATLAFEAAVRPYLTLGLVAFVGLTAMGLTSTDGMVGRLGAERWKRLHGLVHPIVIVALVHLTLQSKLDLFQGALLTGLASGGLAVRVAIFQRVTLGWGVVAAATLAAFLGAAAWEAAWFALKTGRDIGPIVAANLSVAARIAPSWWAAGTTLGLGIAALVYRAWSGRARGR
jgi:sulfoxide reductase heme-binding subunit YedZ